MSAFFKNIFVKASCDILNGLNISFYDEALKFKSLLTFFKATTKNIYCSKN